MILNRINLNQLRVFESVYRSRSMTLAARELHLTQSGVSQHIKTLEESLGVSLFARIKQKLVPSSEANLLYKQCSKSLNELEKMLSQIQTGEMSLRGEVAIGMPVEFGINVLIPLLSEFSRKNPAVQFDLRLGLASEMSERLLSGELDFAFVDSVSIDPRLTLQSAYDEVVELCILEEKLNHYPLPKHASGKDWVHYFESLPYVEYLREEPILRLWFDHHLSDRNLDIEVKARVMDTQAIARLIAGGVGAGILPLHLVEKLRQEGVALHRFTLAATPLQNRISLAYLKERGPSAQAKALQQFLTEHMEGLHS